MIGSSAAHFFSQLSQGLRPFLPADHAQQQAFPPFGPEWLSRTYPSTWHWNWAWQTLVQSALQEITDGSLRRLLLTIPIRHGKSEMVTVRYAVYRLERDPTTRIILGAYSQDLANLFSRKIRRLAQARGVCLAQDSRRMDDWETVAGGGLRAAGVGTGITGRGADLILIDDPVKNREEAESEAYRQRCWEWYHDDLWTRQEPGAAIVLTMSRWHEGDLSGMVQAAQKTGGEQWRHISLPAIAEEGDLLGRKPGQALCPDRFNEAALEQAKTVLGRSFWALYQGRPQAAGGSTFQSSWFQGYAVDGEYYLLYRRDRDRPERVRRADCWKFTTNDLAASLKTQADWTACCHWAVTPRKDLLLLRVRRERIEGPEVIQLLKDEHRRGGGEFLAVEKNGLSLPIVQQVIRDGLPVHGVTVHTEKLARALGAAARYEAGTIFHPDGAADAGSEMLQAYETELLSFPNGNHDDQVDCVSMASVILGSAGAVFPEFQYAVHVAQEPVPFDPGRPIVCGWASDPRLSFVACQLAEPRRTGDQAPLYVLCSLLAEGEGLYEFAERCASVLQRSLGDAAGMPLSDLDLRHYGDPDWQQVGSRSEEARNGAALVDVLFRGVHVTTGYDKQGRSTNGVRPGWRWRVRPGSLSRLASEEAIRTRLSLLLTAGQPALVVDEAARSVIDALNGGLVNVMASNGGEFRPEWERSVHAATAEALGHCATQLFTAKPKREEFDPRLTNGAGICRAPGNRQR